MRPGQWWYRPGSDVTAVLTPHREEGLRDLLQRADSRGIHQNLEDVLVARRSRRQPGQCGRSLVAMLRGEFADPLQLRLFLRLRAAREFEHAVLLLVRTAEGVDADDRQAALVLAAFVQHGLV